METWRRGVGVDTALGSFFLCERVPLLVRCGAAEPGVERIAGVDGIAAAAGWEDAGPPSAERASKSERWFANVFWDWRILRTAGVTLPWLTINRTSISRILLWCV